MITADTKKIVLKKEHSKFKHGNKVITKQGAVQTVIIQLGDRVYVEEDVVFYYSKDLTKYRGD